MRTAEGAVQVYVQSFRPPTVSVLLQHTASADELETFAMLFSV